MIVGLVGNICSGKEEFANYLVKKHNFNKVNLIERFKEKQK